MALDTFQALPALNADPHALEGLALAAWWLDRADALEGGAGYDYASYAHAKGTVQVALDLSLSAFGDAVGDTFTSVEGVLGSDHNDVIYGYRRKNVNRPKV